jgi:hypothetical protein
MIERASSGDPSLLALLRRHPRVAAVEEDAAPGLRFAVGDWQREVAGADPSAHLFGLVELMDNNPLVCADRASVPSAAGTLALIALGPIAEAGVLAEPPVLIFSFEADEADVAASLATAHWQHGATLHAAPAELGSVLACTAMAQVATPERLEDLDEIYEERFGRSFFIRREEAAEWTPELARDEPRAYYRLRITPDEPYSLLTVQVLADRHGKCGAAQMVHAMNVMAGLEESLGIA